MEGFNKLKRSRFLRRWWKAVNDDAKKILTRASGTAILYLVFQVFLYRKNGVGFWGVRELTIVEIAWAVFFIITGWLVVSMVSAFVRVRKADKDAGQWIGSKFLFHQPINVFTTQVGPENHEEVIWFPVIVAEPKTLITGRVETDGGLAQTSVVSPYGYLKNGVLGSGEKFNVRINEKREAGLQVFCPNTQSDPTRVEVSIFSWEWDSANLNPEAFNIEETRNSNP